MLKSARKEVDIYDRNRETLFDLRHGDLRGRIQNLIIRITMPLEGIFDTTDEIRRCQDTLRDAGAIPRPDLETRIASLTEQRDGGYEFIVETVQELPRIIRDLEPLAHHSFRELDEIGRNI
jgi:hypothetical protein